MAEAGGTGRGGASVSRGSTGTSDVRDAVGGLIEGVVLDVISRAEVNERIRNGAQFYQRVSVVKSGLTLGFCIATQNYTGAALVIASHVAGEKVGTAAADIILEKGGFAAKLKLDDQLRAKQNQMMAGTFQMHSSTSIWHHYQEEVYWGAKHAHAMGELAMAAVAMGDGAVEQALGIAPGVGPRPYRRFGFFERAALYRGTWEDDDREGWGTLEYPKFGNYAGSWAKGAPTGYGRIDYLDGSFYAGEMCPGAGDRLLGVSVSKDGVAYAGEHRFPLHVFPDGVETASTQILPDGYGVRIDGSDVQHATWRNGEIECELFTKERYRAQIFEDLVARGQAPPEFIVRGAEWRLKEAKLNSVWSLLRNWVDGSGTVFLFERAI